MSYHVKEIFYTLQGEGAQSGRPAVFLRFSGCNLWSGREADRAGAICRFCDTDFLGVDGPGGGVFDSADALADAVRSKWPLNDSPQQKRYVVCTGGEPLLQLDTSAVDALREAGFEVAVETNGTRACPAGVGWVCVSPKAGAQLLLTTGDELKLVYPQEHARPECYERLTFRYFFLQPMDGPELRQNTQLALEYCRRRPQWRLSLQTHKQLGIP